MFITNDTEYRVARDQIVEFAMLPAAEQTEAKVNQMEQLMIELDQYVQATYEAPTYLAEIAALPSENERNAAMQAFILNHVIPGKLN